jgi:hypothetical protein
MAWKEAEHLLLWISVVMGVVGYLVAVWWHRRYLSYDWVETLARSLFGYLQFALWGTVAALVIMEALGVDFGGMK